MGCHRLLRAGNCTCVTGTDDVRELLGERTGVLVGGGAAAEGDAYGERTRVLDALSARSARATDEVARRAGFTVGQAAALLGLLELEGRAERRAAGWVQRETAAPPRSRQATLW